MNDLADYCSRSSEAQGESLAGTASVASAWLFVEVHEPWGRKIPKDSELPESVREQLASWQRARPDLRIQLIRRPGSTQSQRSVFFADMDPTGIRVAETTIADIFALSTLELDALAAEASDCFEPVYFVCTHGARDRCCAKWGMPVYGRLAELRPERTWQTSHLGGHRFAPTLITLPTGLVYGRVQVAEVDALVAASEGAEVYSLGRLRGRANFGAAAQAADIAVRREHGLAGVSTVRWIAEQSLDGRDRSRVELAIAGRSITVDLEARTASARMGSCGDDPSSRRELVVVGRPT